VALPHGVNVGNFHVVDLMCANIVGRDWQGNMRHAREPACGQLPAFTLESS
jgi:hypothetical protein